MKLYAGLDVSLETTSVCVVDEEGRLRLEAQCSSEPACLIAALEKADGEFVRVGLEAGPLSQWLYFGLIEAGLPAVCIETRHAKAAIGAMAINKNDRNDARSIAQVIPVGLVQDGARQIRREPGAPDSAGQPRVPGQQDPRP